MLYRGVWDESQGISGKGVRDVFSLRADFGSLSQEGLPPTSEVLAAKKEEPKLDSSSHINLFQLMIGRRNLFLFID